MYCSWLRVSSLLGLSIVANESLWFFLPLVVSSFLRCCFYPIFTLICFGLAFSAFGIVTN